MIVNLKSLSFFLISSQFKIIRNIEQKISYKLPLIIFYWNIFIRITFVYIPCIYKVSINAILSAHMLFHAIPFFEYKTKTRNKTQVFLIDTTNITYKLPINTYRASISCTDIDKKSYSDIILLNKTE